MLEHYQLISKRDRWPWLVLLDYRGLISDRASLDSVQRGSEGENFSESRTVAKIIESRFFVQRGKKEYLVNFVFPLTALHLARLYR